MKKENKKGAIENKRLKEIYLGDEKFYSYIVGKLEVNVPNSRINSFNICGYEEIKELFGTDVTENGLFYFQEMTIEVCKKDLTPRELEILGVMSVSDIRLVWEDVKEPKKFIEHCCKKDIKVGNNNVTITLKAPSAEDDYEYECEDDTCDICNVCMINKIASTPTDDLDTEEVYFMLDMLVEILIRYNLLTKEHREIDEGEINVNGCTHSELVQMTENIITKITNIMFDYAILD